MRSAVREALVAAEREKFALGQRREQARTRATILAGTDTYEHKTRLPQGTTRLAESEAEMSRAENRLLDLDRHISKLKRIEGAILDESDIPSRKRRKRPSVAFRPTFAMLSGIGGPPSTLTTGCAIPMLDKTNELETNDEPQPQSVANKELPKPVQHRRFDQWLIARGEPLKEGGGKAFRASAILAFRNGPSPSCL